jgi:hypothetical protein
MTEVRLSFVYQLPSKDSYVAEFNSPRESTANSFEVVIELLSEVMKCEALSSYEVMIKVFSTLRKHYPFEDFFLTLSCPHDQENLCVTYFERGPELKNRFQRLLCSSR